MEKGSQHLKDIFKTVLGDVEQRPAKPPQPSIYVRGDRNVILLGGIVHMRSDALETPKERAP
jgi:hypothetical protein